MDPYPIKHDPRMGIPITVVNRSCSKEVALAAATSLRNYEHGIFYFIIKENDSVLNK